MQTPRLLNITTIERHNMTYLDQNQPSVIDGIRALIHSGNIVRTQLKSRMNLEERAETTAAQFDYFKSDAIALCARCEDDYPAVLKAIKKLLSPIDRKRFSIHVLRYLIGKPYSAEELKSIQRKNKSNSKTKASKPSKPATQIGPPAANLSQSVFDSNSEPAISPTTGYDNQTLDGSENARSFFDNA